MWIPCPSPLRRLLEDPGHAEILDAPIGVELPATGEGV